MNEQFKLILDLIKTLWPIGLALFFGMSAIVMYYIKTSLIDPVKTLKDSYDKHLEDHKEKDKHSEEEKKEFLKSLEANLKAIEDDVVALWRYKADNQSIEAKIKDIETKLFDVMVKITGYFSGGSS